MRIPKFKGADTSKVDQSAPLDTTDAPLLEFSRNEAYGPIQTGIAIGWNGTLTEFRIWHTSRHGVTGFPTDRLTIDRLIMRGDASVVASPFEYPAGVWTAIRLRTRILYPL